MVKEIIPMLQKLSREKVESEEPIVPDEAAHAHLLLGESGTWKDHTKSRDERVDGIPEKSALDGFIVFLAVGFDSRCLRSGSSVSICLHRRHNVGNKSW